MDVDTIIYIVIILASILIGAFGKSRKKQANTTARPSFNPIEEEKAVPYEMTFKDLFKESQETPYQEEEFYINEAQEEETEDNIEENFNKEILDTAESKLDVINEEEGIRSVIVNKKEDISSESEEKEDSSDISEDFDVKTAIIYSEILNQKYF